MVVPPTPATMGAPPGAALVSGSPRSTELVSASSTRGLALWRRRVTTEQGRSRCPGGQHGRHACHLSRGAMGEGTGADDVDGCLRRLERAARWLTERLRPGPEPGSLTGDRGRWRNCWYARLAARWFPAAGCTERT